NYLVKIKYEDGSKLYYSYYVALINNEQQILESDFIEGCKYHNGTLRIEDWNNDGIQNIIYNIDYPTSSVP
ncbi:MAG: hypothetical protein ACPGVD_10815, partial [Flavobacteriales bacterium]